MANFTEGLEKLPFYDEKDLSEYELSTESGGILFTMFGETTEFRVRTLLTKEPETIRWINTFKPGETFWDIGANIGCYSLYAANRNITVQAFEPSPVNFWLLARNVAVNKLDKLTAYPFGISDRTGIFFWEPNVSAGSADNQLLSESKTACVQSYSIDELVMCPGVEFPNHIKLDVDGIEKLILEGGKNTLGDKRVQSLMCEVTEGDPDTGYIVDFIKQQGFNDPITRHAPYYDDYHYAPMFNYLFTKN